MSYIERVNVFVIVSRLWNAVITSGSIYVLVMVAVELLVNIRNDLFELAKNSNMLDYNYLGASDSTSSLIIVERCRKLSIDTQRSVIYRALAAWTKEGRMLYPKKMH